MGSVRPIERLDDLVELRRMRGRDDHPVPVGAARRQPAEDLRRGRAVRAPQRPSACGVAADACRGSRSSSTLDAVDAGRAAPRSPDAARAAAPCCADRRRPSRRPASRRSAAAAIRRARRYSVIDVVRVRRQHDVADRQADVARPDAGQRVAEIAGRHDEVRAAAALARTDRETRLRVVDHLRQQPADVDAVRRREARASSASAGSRERLLHHALAIVERAARRRTSARCRPSTRAAAPGAPTPGPSDRAATTSTHGLP